MHRTEEPRPGQGPSVLEMALEYHRHGWSIIPIAAGTKKPPKGFRWKRYQKLRPTEDELRFWLADRDDLGLAVVFGEISGGLACRDFDGLESYRRWRRGHSDLARMLPTVETARGRHVYFRAPPSHQLFKDLGPHEKGEYRGDSAHYCLLPPSPHPAGSQYKWLVPLPEGDVPLIEDVVAAGFLPQEFFSPMKHRRRKEATRSLRWLLGLWRQLVKCLACPSVLKQQSRQQLPTPCQQDLECAEGDCSS